MVVVSDFSVEQVQATGYIASGELVTSRILRKALAERGDVYDANPISLPLPANAPRDVPGAILSSKDGSRRLEIARSRVNIYVNRLDNQASLNIGEHFPLLAEELSAMFGLDDDVIGRLAAVVQRAADTEAPARSIATQYFRDEWLARPLNRPGQLEIHAHKVFDLRPGLPVNSWMRIRTAERIPAGSPVIAVEQDLNTLAEGLTTSSFNQGDVAEFYRLAATELDTILGLYFPELTPQAGGA